MGLSVTEPAVEVKSAYSAALENFDLAADALELDPDIREMIKYPEPLLSKIAPMVFAV